MVVSFADPGIFARGEGGSEKTLITFLGISFFSFKEGYQCFILNKTIFLRFQRGSNILQGRGSKFFGGGGGANVNIELVNFQGGGSRNSGSAHAYDRSTCFFSEANPERQVFSCNGSFSIVTLQNMIRYMILDILSGSTLYIRTGILSKISMR